MARERGFTLVELVITMVLISILAVSVLPKLFGRSDFTPYTIRDQLLGQLRVVQLQALNRMGECQTLIITPSEFGLAATTDASNNSFDPRPDNVIALDDVSVSIDGDNTLKLRFDADGKISSGDCAGGCVINIVGSESVRIIIEPQGYIHVSS